MVTPEHLAHIKQSELIERIRNFHDGALARCVIKAVAVGTSLGIVGDAAMTDVANGDPLKFGEPVALDAGTTAPATTTLTPEQKQQCIDEALAMPGQTNNPPAMYHAGVRPLTGHPTQIIRGSLAYADLPQFCAPAGLARISRGTPQEKKGNQWVKATTSLGDPYLVGNLGGTANIFDAPPHAWPEFAFNDPVKGPHGYHFHRMRLVIDNYLKDKTSQQFLGHNQGILPLPVHGGYARAISSKRKAERKGLTEQPK